MFFSFWSIIAVISLGSSSTFTCRAAAVQHNQIYFGNPNPENDHDLNEESIERIRTPNLCPDNSSAPQYSGYLANSSIFFWFFPSRSNPYTDPIGLWTNGGPGSSALTGMQFAGPCQIVPSLKESDSSPWEMVRNEWSLNNNASILMIDNPRGAGFSYAPFPAVNSVYESAIEIYEFLQAFFKRFPEYSNNPFAVNSLSYGGHYAPVYASYIQHRNSHIQGIPSKWDDIDQWILPAYPKQDQTKTGRIINLTSISVGNGWINSRKQYRPLVEFACGYAEEEGIPFLADKEDCHWALEKLKVGEGLMDRCESKDECIAASLYTMGVASFPFDQTGLNTYDYRLDHAYDEKGITSFYNNISVQIQLGVINTNTNSNVNGVQGEGEGEVAKKWEAHSARVWIDFVYGGDWDITTDYLFERLLESGISILKYEGMVDHICNYLGIRRIMSNLPNYTHQQTFNNLSMKAWYPLHTPHHLDESPDTNSKPPGSYKCLMSDVKGKGNLCYIELQGVGHIASLDKPFETSVLLSKWMTELQI